MVTALLLVNINDLCNQRVHLNDNNVLEMEMISLCVFETFLRKNDKTIAVQPGSVKMTKNAVLFIPGHKWAMSFVIETLGTCACTYRPLHGIVFRNISFF